ncbi:MAG: hypothetical protein Q8O13_06200 [Candidatus Omnitrophota bacterium]|nr:hypothetical protein [Candidatus Omnitrophota bacterium]
MKSCFKLPEFVLDTLVMKKICKYHKRKGQVYKSDDIVRDFCLDAFYVAYPYCLAFLYDADKNEFKNKKITLFCPNPKGITFEITRIPALPLFIRIVWKLFVYLLSKMSIRLDWADLHWCIKLKVTENKGSCPAGYVAGKTYWFNTRRLDELCPASFHGIYPFLLSYLLGYSLPWQKQGEIVNIHCPDHEGIVYGVWKEA